MRTATTRRADAFASALDGAAGADDSLVLLAQALRDLPAPTIDAAASDRIRQRLVAVAAVAPTESVQQTPRTTRALPLRGRRYATVAVGGLTVLTAVTGVGVAASNSLPGNPFYSVKRATEAVQLDLAGSPAAKGQRELEFANTRLHELQQVGPHSSHAVALLRSINTDATAAKTDLLKSYRSSGSVAPLQTLNSFAREQFVGLVHVAATAPTSLKPVLTQDAQALVGIVTTVHQLAGNLCLTCLVTPTTPPTTPVPATTPAAPTESSKPTPRKSGTPSKASTSSAPSTRHSSSTPSSSTKPTRSKASPSPSTTGGLPTPSLPIQLPSPLTSVVKKILGLLP